MRLGERKVAAKSVAEGSERMFVVVESVVAEGEWVSTFEESERFPPSRRASELFVIAESERVERRGARTSCCHGEREVVAESVVAEGGGCQPSWRASESPPSWRVSVCSLSRRASERPAPRRAREMIIAEGENVPRRGERASCASRRANE